MCARVNGGVAWEGYRPTRLRESVTVRPSGVVRFVLLALRFVSGDTAVSVDARREVSCLARGRSASGSSLWMTFEGLPVDK
jgi:hypothetical protein